MHLDEDEMYSGNSASKSGGQNKFAVMMGLEGDNAKGPKNGPSNTRRPFPTDVNGKGNASIAESISISSTDSINNSTDDPVEPFRRSGTQSQVVLPVIGLKAEQNIIYKKTDKGKKGLLCMITLQVPSFAKRPSYGPRRTPELQKTVVKRPADLAKLRATTGPVSASSVDSRSSPISVTSMKADPFNHVAMDLKQRMHEYKSSGIDALGRIRLFDILQVRKGEVMLDIMVFLYDQAIICVAEDKKRTLKSLLSPVGGGSRKNEDRSSKKVKTPLKLKGRIYFRDVSRIVDSSVPGELSATIQMKANMESFIIIFRDQSTLALWVNTLNLALSEINGLNTAVSVATSSAPTPTTAGSSKLARMGFQTDTPSHHTTLSRTQSTISSPPGQADSLSATTEHEWGVPLAPVHTPLDLVIVVSIPTLGPSNSSGAHLKLDLIVSTLHFVLATLGNHDRVCLVAHRLGQDGWIKRTPLLNSTIPESRTRLERFISGLHEQSGDKHEEFLFKTGNESQVDVVGAINAALDIVLQRKRKNPLSGMIVISETGAQPNRASTDLVIARLDAAR